MTTVQNTSGHTRTNYARVSGHGVSTARRAFVSARADDFQGAIDHLLYMPREDVARLNPIIGRVHQETLLTAYNRYLTGSPGIRLAEPFLAAVTSIAAATGAIASIHVRLLAPAEPADSRRRLIKVVLAAHCPVCQAMRGPVEHKVLYTSRGPLRVGTWTNPCGHRDLPAALLIEAGLRKPAADLVPVGAGR